MLSSSILQIDSRDRTSGTPSDFTVNLNGNSITNATRVCPIGCSFTHVLPNIDSVRENDTLTLKLIKYNVPRYNKFCLEIASYDSLPGQYLDDVVEIDPVRYNVIFDINTDFLRDEAHRPTLGDHKAASGQVRKDINNLCFMLQQQLQLKLVEQKCPNTDYIKFIPVSSNTPKFRIIRSPSMIFRVRRFSDYKDEPEFKEIESKESGFYESEWLIPCKFPMKVSDDNIQVGTEIHNKAMRMSTLYDVVQEGWVNVWANNIRRLEGYSFANEYSEYKNNKRKIDEITCGYIDIEIQESLFFLGTDITVSIMSGSYNINQVIDGLSNRINTLIKSWLTLTNIPRITNYNLTSTLPMSITLDPIRYTVKIALDQFGGWPFCFFIPEGRELVRQLGLYSSASEYVRREDSTKYSDPLSTPMWRSVQEARSLVDIYPISGMLIFAPGLVNANTINSRGESLPLLARISNLGSFGQRTVWENWSAFELFLQASSSSISKIRIYLTDLDYKPIIMNADWNLSVAVFSITNE